MKSWTIFVTMSVVLFSIGYKTILRQETVKTSDQEPCANSIPTSAPGAEGKLKQFYTSCITNARSAALLISSVQQNYFQDVRPKFRSMSTKRLWTRSQRRPGFRPRFLSIPGLTWFTMLNPDHVEDLYSSLPLDPIDFLENVKQVDKLNKRLEFNPSLNVAMMAATRTITANAANFASRLSTFPDFVFIPLGWVQMPRFHPGFLGVFKFANLGVTVGHELGHAVWAQINGVTLDQINLVSGLNFQISDLSVQISDI
ncbi:Endothelin-converting enzyme 2 [Folsomia candida]|uniref:Endothelin-converting enzyme 2 n=1 Tax=Folsomia candida TaxID=158441 RepID=A0A226DMC0_FOLCA|nr:Endothelin-converting enzyme 2 [Folsomia candida]